MRSIINNLRILLILVLIGIGAFTSADIYQKYKYRWLGSKEGITKVMVVEPDGGATRELAVLFIGNSYTFFNNMPEMMVNIAGSDPDNKTRFIVQAVTRSGFRLADHWEDGVALKLIYSRHWDYVVLQDQSTWALNPNWTHTAFLSAGKFNDEIKKIGAHTLLFTTWPKQPDSKWYETTEYGDARNPSYMQQQFNQKNAQLAQKLGAVVIPIGGYWMSILDKQPDYPLYLKDGTHPNLAGTYLTAMIFYRYFVGYNPQHITYLPYGLQQERADYLKSVASW